MPLVTDGLVNHLDALTLLSQGYTNGQDLTVTNIPDRIDSKGWGGDGYGLSFYLSGGPNNFPVMRFLNGFLHQRNANDFLQFNSMSVMIAASRTGASWTNNWMGLYSMYYNHAKAGINILAITDNKYDRNFNGWGTYNGTTTVKSTSAMALNTPTIVSVTIGKDSSGTFYTNASATGTFSGSKVQGYFGIGGLESANGFFRGDVYEVLTYNRTLTESEVASNADYLNSKWFNAIRIWNNARYSWDDATYTWAIA